MSSAQVNVENNNDFLVNIVTKGKIMKKENGVAIISIDCPVQDGEEEIVLLKKDLIEKPIKANHCHVTEMLQQAIEKINALQTKIVELETSVINNTMAQQRRHKFFAEYVWKFNNSTMQQLGDIGIRQAEFTQVLRSCKPTLQEVVNFTHRGVEL